MSASPCTPPQTKLLQPLFRRILTEASLHFAGQRHCDAEIKAERNQFASALREYHLLQWSVWYWKEDMEAVSVPDLCMMSQSNWGLELPEFRTTVFSDKIALVLQFFKAQLDLKPAKIRCYLLLHWEYRWRVEERNYLLINRKFREVAFWILGRSMRKHLYNHSCVREWNLLLIKDRKEFSQTRTALV